MAFERILVVKKTEEEFVFDDSMNVDDYFKYTYGVYIPDNRKEPTEIYVKAYDTEPCYLRDSPLHCSQQEIESNDEYTIFKYTLFPTTDFLGDIIQKGGRLEVIYPLSISEEITKFTEETAKSFRDNLEQRKRNGFYK